MPFSLDDKLVVAISSRALFDLEDSHEVFSKEGPDAYQQYQLDRLDEPAKPGLAFPLVKKLLKLNHGDRHRVEVVVLSRNDPVSGLRVFRSAEHHGLAITRGAFTQGRSPWPYLLPSRAKLFLSAEPEDVRHALEQGIPAATLYHAAPRPNDDSSAEIRIAFDGDAVLFGDSAERVFKERQLEGFHQHEREKRSEPLEPGPFAPFLRALHELQSEPDLGEVGIRTALVTARNAPAHDRAIRTLMEWKVRVDEAFFLGGVEKGEFLAAFRPDFFFDDQQTHISSARSHSVPAGHVPFGVANEPAKPSSVPSEETDDGTESLP